MKQLNAITSRTHLPHSKLDNQQTHFDSVRLLKGAAPGRKQVSFYSSELNCLRNSKMFAQRAQIDHLYDVLAGKSNIWKITSIFDICKPSSGNYSWSIHHTGMGGPTADQKFYDPERVCLVSNRKQLYRGNLIFRWKTTLDPSDLKTLRGLFLLWPENLHFLFNIKSFHQPINSSDQRFLETFANLFS